jgi:acetyl esterase/lipase
MYSGYTLTALLYPTSEIPGVTCFQQTEPARKLINLVDIPVLAVTSEASYHAQYDNCSVEYLRQAGVSVEHIRLADVGIHGLVAPGKFCSRANSETGNGHMFFMEKNGIQIADQVIRPWISKIRK